MGSFRCPDCNASVRAAMKKIKGDEIGSGMSKKELLIKAINLLQEPTPIDQIEIEGVSPAAVGKAIQIMINRDQISGKIENEVFLPNQLS
jgi:hypothetical protein